MQTSWAYLGAVLGLTGSLLGSTLLPHYFMNSLFMVYFPYLIYITHSFIENTDEVFISNQLSVEGIGASCLKGLKWGYPMSFTGILFSY